MKKFFTLFAIMMAFAFTAKAQTITVPAELNGWYAGCYIDGDPYAEVCSNVMNYYAYDGLDATEWTASDQEALEENLGWGKTYSTEDDYYGQISNNTFTVGYNWAQYNFIAFFIVDNAHLVAGANWRIYLPKAKGDYTLTADDLLFQGTFGVGVTTAIEEVEAAVKAQKVIENGQMIIIRDGKKFNAVGAKL